MELVEFLLARIAEDEAAARLAAEIPDRVRMPSDVRELGNLPSYEGQWGWGGGPFRVAGQDPAIVAALGMTDSDGPYHVSVSKAWDESEPTGARYDVATIPGDHDAARHIARWDPRRVLAECEAKRGIVARLTELARAEGDETYGDASVALTDTIRRLALPYADHPDYEPAWRVDD